MTTVIVRINSNLLRLAIEKYSMKTGIECRSCPAEKAAYLDSHIFNKIGDREVPIGVQFEILLRVMVRWVVFYNPQLIQKESSKRSMAWQVCAANLFACGDVA
jgi:hypothetical protein